jgi:hypothetical protein
MCESFQRTLLTRFVRSFNLSESWKSRNCGCRNANSKNYSKQVKQESLSLTPSMKNTCGLYLSRRDMSIPLFATSVRPLTRLTTRIPPLPSPISVFVLIPSKLLLDEYTVKMKNAIESVDGNRKISGTRNHSPARLDLSNSSLADLPPGRERKERDELARDESKSHSDDKTTPPDIPKGKPIVTGLFQSRKESSMGRSHIGFGFRPQKHLKSKLNPPKVKSWKSGASHVGMIDLRFTC